MAVIAVDDLLARIGEKLNGSDDETLAMIEDVADTIRDLEARAVGDGEDWRAKYDALDEEWRARYRARFFEPREKDKNEVNIDVHLGNDEEEEKTKFEDLFEEVK